MLDPYDVIPLDPIKRADPFESVCIDAQNFDLKRTDASSQVRSSVNHLNAVNED